MTSSSASWIWTPTTSGFALGQLGERLADVEDVRAAGVGPGRLLAAVHLAQLRARVVAVLGGDAVGAGVEDDAVARLGQVEELAVVRRELGALDGVRAALLAGGQGQVPLVGVDQLARGLRRGAPGTRKRGDRAAVAGGGGGGGGRADIGVVGLLASPRGACPPRSPCGRCRPARSCRAPATAARGRLVVRSWRVRGVLASVARVVAVASLPSRRRPGRPRPDRSTPGRRRRRRRRTGAGRPRRLHRPRTARRRPRPRPRCPGAPGTNRPTRARPRSAARAGWPAAGGCSARDGLGGANAEPRTCLPKPRAGWTSGVGVRRAGGESRCPVPRPARSGFEKEPSGRFPIGCLRTGEVGVPRGERWNPLALGASGGARTGRRTVGPATSGRQSGGGAGAMLVGGTRPASPGCSTTIVKRTGSATDAGVAVRGVGLEHHGVAGREHRLGGRRRAGPGVPASTESTSTVPIGCASPSKESPGCSVQSHSSTTSGGSVPMRNTALLPAGLRPQRGGLLGPRRTMTPRGGVAVDQRRRPRPAGPTPGCTGWRCSGCRARSRPG